MVRHRVLISCLRQEDLGDADYLIENELPLVHCICYVTSRYLHGGKETREMLLPEVLRIQREIFNVQPGGRQGDGMSLLRALIVLYAYSDLTPPTSDSSGKEDVLYWPLKSLIEVYGLKLSLHRSVQDLRAEIRAGRENVMETKAYKKYVIWIWLYTMSYQYRSSKNDVGNEC